jgi:hypothetical protein
VASNPNSIKVSALPWTDAQESGPQAQSCIRRALNQLLQAFQVMLLRLENCPQLPVFGFEKVLPGGEQPGMAPAQAQGNEGRSVQMHQGEMKPTRFREWLETPAFLVQPVMAMLIVSERMENKMSTNAVGLRGMKIRFEEIATKTSVNQIVVRVSTAGTDGDIVVNG